jgi:predicted Zn-dependent peptidase
VLADIDHVQIDDAKAVAETYFAPDQHAVVWLGPNV